MSDQPKWMPSDEEMDQARVKAALLRETFGPEADDNEPIRALIRAAVEKALAEVNREANGLKVRLIEQEAKVRRATLEEAARAVCPLCESHYAIGYDKETVGAWVHDPFMVNPAHYERCKASEIHDLIAALDKEAK